MSRFLIAAAHKSSGKTVISVGLAAHFASNGTPTQCFKKGPDYIDPMWLGAASGRPCYNLDFNTMSDAEINQLLGEKSQDADISLIEANKGLFDGVDLSGCDSNAQLAKITRTPVIMVIDTNGMTRGIAPLLLGYQKFDPDVNIAGVILNKVGGTRHEGKLHAAVKAYTDLPVFGAVWRSADLSVDERHLGLITPQETTRWQDHVARVESNVSSSIELNALKEIASRAPETAWSKPKTVRPGFSDLKVGIARDAAFGFYYPDDLEAFETSGAQIVFFDTMSSKKLPEIDCLFIGGGFPETQMEALSDNTNLRDDIRNKVNAGLPTYAECGGLMYLCKSIRWEDRRSPMCGVFGANISMCKKPQGRGYIEFTSTRHHPWPPSRTSVKAHEFHYAKLDQIPENACFAQNLSRGSGINGNSDGLVKINTLATFSHQRNTQSNPWIEDFLRFAQEIKTRR